MRWFVWALLPLTLNCAACSRRPQGNIRDVTEHWRPNIEFEVYPRASRELGCPRTYLDFWCSDMDCDTVMVFGCGRTASYLFDSSHTWVMVAPPQSMAPPQPVAPQQPEPPQLVPPQQPELPSQ